ncbi:hypothetical protein OPV22_008669 [Ensete ventricosum]|uniref:Uncharacterized protein n=1 Tax=Ensete ventricosum TaxID=4639 RepID=A0AAV8RCU0_ENSVE|nr:hypothetical protein OPV22_008669 [Ensete ventricosum]
MWPRHRPRRLRITSHLIYSPPLPSPGGSKRSQREVEGVTERQSKAELLHLLRTGFLRVSPSLRQRRENELCHMLMLLYWLDGTRSSMLKGIGH